MQQKQRKLAIHPEIPSQSELDRKKERQRQLAETKIEFVSRNTRDMRMIYLSKLTYKNVWLAPIAQPKDVQNIIILDWDDTLLPTTCFLR